MASGEPQGVIHGLQRDLQLQHDAVGGAQQIACVVDVGGGQTVVCSFDNEDAILTGAFHEDWRHSAGNAGSDMNVAGVDPVALEVRNGGRPEHVIAHPRHHGHVRTAPPGGYGLVRAFTAESQIEALSEDGFARLRKLVRESCQIDVGTAHYHDARHFLCLLGVNTAHEGGDIQVGPVGILRFEFRIQLRARGFGRYAFLLERQCTRAQIADKSALVCNQRAVPRRTVIGQYVLRVEGGDLIENRQPACRCASIAVDVGNDFVLHHIARNQRTVGFDEYQLVTPGVRTAEPQQAGGDAA